METFEGTDGNLAGDAPQSASGMKREKQKGGQRKGDVR